MQLIDKCRELFLRNKSLLWRLSKFGLVGMVATCIHICIATSLSVFFLASQVVANCSAFSLATIFSYTAHTKWSFASNISRKSLLRFMAVTGFCFLLTALISWISEHLGFSFKIGITMVILIVPCFSYLLHRFWTYKHSPIA